MVLVKYTNIVIDEFTFAKRHKKTTNYIYFLTHWHSDHYVGLTQGWSYGPIYCSQITKKLLLTKYNRLTDKVIGLKLNNQYQISMDEKFTMKVRMFDSNHIAGSVLILLEGYFGRILHTGDMRFHEKMFESIPYLFSNYSKREQEQNSLIIDQLILDNTYCDPIFKFPARSKAVQQIVIIINKNKNKRVYIATDTIGKEQLFIVLAQIFQTFIVVNQQRFLYIKCMNVNHHLFTLDQSLGWIQVIKKGQITQRLFQHKNSIVITLTGWVNIETYHTYDEKKYLVPYSLHSNFGELETFVRAIRPAKITPIVKSDKSEKINKIVKFEGYMNTLYHLNQRGLEFLNRQYLRPLKSELLQKQDVLNEVVKVLELKQLDQNSKSDDLSKEEVKNSEH